MDLRRLPFPLALTLAAVSDATRLVGTVAGFAASASWCRIRGHETRIVACPEVTRLCVRCGASGSAIRAR